MAAGTGMLFWPRRSRDCSRRGTWATCSTPCSRCATKPWLSQPCLLGIDKVDALGSRERDSGSNVSYDREMIAGFLELLDGTEAPEGVLVIEACNHLQHLDPPLIRPGRLGHLVEVSRPGPAGLLRVLRHYLAREFAALCLGDAKVAALLAHLLAARLPTSTWQRAVRSAVRCACQSLGVADTACTPAPTRELLWALLRRAAVHGAGHAVAMVAID